VSESERLVAEVFLDGHLPADQEQVLLDALTALSIRTHVKVVPARRGLGDLQWLVLVTVPLQAFLILQPEIVTWPVAT
jgi:hypothetical protein